MVQKKKLTERRSNWGGRKRCSLSPPAMPPPLALCSPVSIAADEPFQIDGFFRRFPPPSLPLSRGAYPLRCPPPPAARRVVRLSSSRATALSSWSLVHYFHSNPQAAFTCVGEQSYKTLLIASLHWQCNGHRHHTVAASQTGKKGMFVTLSGRSRISYSDCQKRNVLKCQMCERVSC